jgi:hypothetical protein
MYLTGFMSPRKRDEIQEIYTMIFKPPPEKLLLFPQFMLRFSRCIALAGSIIVCALVIGISGYHYIADFSWIDAILESSMILAGMGPVTSLPNDTSKLFASVYAIISGVLFLTSIGVVFSPILHLFLHRFHLDERDLNDGT